MFNLVTLVDEDNPDNLLIEPYSDVFINSADSVQLDWTEKIDISQIKLTPLTDLNRNTIFKFTEDDDDYAFNQYKDLVGGHLYGSQKYDAGSEFNILDSGINFIYVFIFGIILKLGYPAKSSSPPIPEIFIFIFLIDVSQIPQGLFLS